MISDLSVPALAPLAARMFSLAPSFAAQALLVTAHALIAALASTALPAVAPVLPFVRRPALMAFLETEAARLVSQTLMALSARVTAHFSATTASVSMVPSETARAPAVLLVIGGLFVPVRAMSTVPTIAAMA